MLKRLLAIGLMIALMSTNFSRFFVFAEFQVNKDYIARTLCENKARPWMNCNGKCYLMKKLKQAEDNEKKQAARDNFSRLEHSLFRQPFRLIFEPPLVLRSAKQTFPFYQHQYRSSFIDTIFRPPKQIA